MADVSKIQGPSGSPESFGKKDKGSVDADKFKQEMRKRVTEVSQIDPDEQKKRKRGEEAEEEDSLEEPGAGPTTPPSQVTPFSLEKTEKKASPLEMQGTGTSPTESAQKASMPAPPSKPYFQTPSTEEMADDSGVLEEESFIDNIPSPLSGEEAPPPVLGAPEAPPAPQTQPIIPGEARPTSQEPPAIAPEQSGQSETVRQPPQKKPAQPPVGPPSEKKATTPVIQPKLAGPAPEKSRKTADEWEGTSPAKERDTTGFFEQLGKEGGEKEGKKPAKTPEELAQEAELQEAAAPPAQPFPLSSSTEEKPGEKVEENETPTETGVGATTPGELPGLATPPPTPEALPPYANIHPQVMEIFDRMVGVMTVMSMSGMTETVITLNTPQFASSVFFGSQIIIQEYSTAPLAYNVQLNGTPEAVALFQGNVDDLMAAFQAGNYNFRVNRLETGYLTDRPLFKRKEKAGGEKESGEGHT